MFISVGVFGDTLELINKTDSTLRCFYNLPLVTLSYDEESQVYKVMYAEMPDETNCHADDIVYVVLLDTEQLFVRLVAVGKRGEAGEEMINVSRLWSNSVVAYCFATSADGKIASRTLHVAIS